MATKAVTQPVKTLEAIRKQFESLHISLDPNYVLRKADEQLVNPKEESDPTTKPEDMLFKAMTLFEFDNGALLTMSVSESYKTFGIDLMKKFQLEYECATPSEKATAALAAVSYIRTLDTQRRITNYLEIGKFTDIGVRYLEMLSKDLDRANRHYLTAIQTLKMLRMPALQVSIRTDTAIIGQNQIVQNNEPK